MGKYQIIYADPPWSYDDKALNRGGAERHYSTMRLEDICALPVAEIAADDALLFMWGAWPKLFEAKSVIDAWGFEFKTCAFVWVKTNKRTNPDQASFFPAESFDILPFGNARKAEARKRRGAPDYLRTDSGALAQAGRNAGQDFSPSRGLAEGGAFRPTHGTRLGFVGQ